VGAGVDGDDRSPLPAHPTDPLRSTPAASEASSAPTAPDRLLRAGLVLLTVLAVALLLLVVALAGLRSEERTAALGSSLAADPVVRELVVEALVDGALEEMSGRSRLLALLAPSLDGPLTVLGNEVLATPAGEAALSSALTDMVRGITTPGPIVIDLRAALTLAARTAPEPLDRVLDELLAGTDLGLIVLAGDPADEQAVGGASTEDARPGAPSTTAIVLAALLMLAALTALTLVGSGSAAARVGRTSLVLLLTTAPVLLVLLVVPELVPNLIGARDALDPRADTVVALVLEGVASLLAPLRATAAGLALVGAVGSIGSMIVRTSVDRARSLVGRTA